ncbi:MAG: extracellular solute-binding protein [bacterium]|nr:extracellular solute-binding protein [bacterium]
MKRFLPFIIVGLVLFLVLSIVLVLFFSRKKAPGPVVLHYLGLWDPEAINPLKEEYQKKNPNIIIEYEQKNASSYFSFLNKALGEKNGPDLFWSHSGWLPVLGSHLASLPDEIYSSSEFEKTFYPLVKESLKSNGSYRGIPLEIDGLALVYNKTLLKAKGFDSPPKDLDSLVNMASVITNYDDRGKIKTAGVALGSSKNVDYFSEIVGQLLLQNKVSFIKDKKNFLASNSSLDGRNLGADALLVYLNFASKYKVWEAILPPSLEAFAQGKVAMAFFPAYKLAEISEIAKDKGVKLSFGVAPVPQVVESDPVSWGSYWANAVNAAGENQLEAWKFAKFLSEESALKKIFILETKIRGLGRAYPRVAMAAELTGDPLLAPYVKQAPFAKTWYLNSDTGEDLLNGKIVESFRKWLDLSATSDDQLGSIITIAKEIEPTLEKFGLSSALAPPGVPQSN